MIGAPSLPHFLNLFVFKLPIFQLIIFGRNFKDSVDVFEAPSGKLVLNSPFYSALSLGSHKTQKETDPFSAPIQWRSATVLHLQYS